MEYPVRPVPNHVHYATVLEWYDGDTVKLDTDQDYEGFNKSWHRLYGVDTPELKVDGKPNPLGAEALSYVQSWAPIGTRLITVSYKAKNAFPTPGSKEKFGRWLVEIWQASAGPDGMSLNEWLIYDGISKPYTGGKR